MKRKTAVISIIGLLLCGLVAFVVIFYIPNQRKKAEEKEDWENLTQGAEERIKNFEVDERLRNIVAKKFVDNPNTRDKALEIFYSNYLWFFSENDNYYEASQRAINPSAPWISNMVATYRINKQTDEIEIYKVTNNNWILVEEDSGGR